MSAVHATIQQQPQQQRFLRKTSLLGSESNTNFKMLDNDIGETITSEEADRVTPLMSKIYTRLLLTPSECKEADRVLRFIGEEGKDGKWTTAWVQLCRHLRVSSETASKALKWMHEQGIIGYTAFKNGVGIRIFLNRATRSITLRKEVSGSKIFGSFHTSTQRFPTSLVETPSNCSFAEKEILEKDLNPLTPKNGADQANFDQSSNPLPQTLSRTSSPGSLVGASLKGKMGESGIAAFDHGTTGGMSKFSLEEITRCLQSALEPSLRAAAIQASRDEHERTREWLEKSGIPKAVRVAQRESYSVLRAYGLVDGKKGGAKFKDEVGRSFHNSEGSNTSAVEFETVVIASQTQTCAQKQLSEAEVLDLADACVALLKTQGKPITVTLHELTGGRHNGGASTSSSEDGGKGKSGWLAATDAERVRALAEELAGGKPYVETTKGGH